MTASRVYRTFTSGLKRAFGQQQRHFAHGLAAPACVSPGNGLLKGAAAAAAVLGSAYYGFQSVQVAEATGPQGPAKRVMDSEETLEFHRRRIRSMKIFSGTGNIPLSRQVAEKLDTKLGKISIKQFADGEIGIQVQENVRGKDIYIIQPTCPPGVNNNMMELLLLISTMRRASARSITAVMPYYGYARQDRKMQSRVPISAADVARLMESMGVDRVVAVDLHCGQIQGFFSPSCPCDNLDGGVVAIPYFSEMLRRSGIEDDDVVVVSPDAGGVYRAKKFRDGLQQMGMKNTGLAMIVKQRQRANMISQMDLVGDVAGKTVIIVDDMIDTAGTLCKAGAELKKFGAKKVYAFATHGLFNGPAITRIEKSDFEKVVVCNTIPLAPNKQIDKIEQLSVAELLANTIHAIQFKTSVSNSFDLKEAHTEVVQRPVS